MALELNFKSTSIQAGKEQQNFVALNRIGEMQSFCVTRQDAQFTLYRCTSEFDPLYPMDMALISSIAVPKEIKTFFK